MNGTFAEHLALQHEPMKDIAGVAGVTLIADPALFSTRGAINSQQYASLGATSTMAVVTLPITSLAIVLFAWYTMQTSPQSCVTLIATIVLAWAVEAIRRSVGKRQAAGERHNG